MAKNSGERILVADDDATSRKLLARILTRAGFGCTEAPDGIEALKLLRSAEDTAKLRGKTIEELVLTTKAGRATPSGGRSVRA